jgi:hypothetical protein
MHKTKNDLPESKRAEAAKLLNSWLADCIDLRMQRNLETPIRLIFSRAFHAALTSTSGWLRRTLKAERKTQIINNRR